MVEADAVVDHGLNRRVVLGVLLVQVHSLVPQESSLASAQHLRRSKQNQKGKGHLNFGIVSGGTIVSRLQQPERKTALYRGGAGRGRTRYKTAVNEK